MSLSEDHRLPVGGPPRNCSLTIGKAELIAKEFFHCAVLVKPPGS